MKQITTLAGTIGFFLAACATPGDSQQVQSATQAPVTTIAVIPTSPVPTNVNDADSAMLAPKAKSAAVAQAPLFVSKPDPSGAPMCFDADGNKALLVHCQRNPSHALRLDPSGSPMCFNHSGGKALLADCGVSSSYVSQSDPSGARECFHRSGEKAALVKCTGAASMSTDMGLVATAN